MVRICQALPQTQRPAVSSRLFCCAEEHV